MASEPDERDEMAGEVHTIPTSDPSSQLEKPMHPWTSDGRSWPGDPRLGSPQKEDPLPPFLGVRPPLAFWPPGDFPAPLGVPERRPGEGDLPLLGVLWPWNWVLD